MAYINKATIYFIDPNEDFETTKSEATTSMGRGNNNTRGITYDEEVEDEK